MGVSYYVYQIVGCRILESKLMRPQTVRKCKCAVEGTPKFCPSCGKEFLVKDLVPMPGYEPHEKLCGLQVVAGNDVYKDRRIYVGLNMKSGGGYHNEDEIRCDITNLPALKEQVKAVLEPLGLWDEAQFGVWSVLYCSC